jgi:lactate dehydrogenase-like 2-hydroxyacid dehydrogenase
MKVIAYSIKSFEKESLILANGKKHDLTLISNELNDKTLLFAKGKEAVVISMDDLLPATILKELLNIGLKYIVIRGDRTDNVDLVTATKIGFKTAYVPTNFQKTDEISHTVIHFLHVWEQGECVGLGCCCSHDIKQGTTDKIA